MNLKKFIRLSIKEKVELYYSFFFEKFALSSEESSIYKTRIIKMLEDELNSYYFDLGYWYIKNFSKSKSLAALQSDFGHLTKKWGVDWYWIIHHIILDFLNIGIAEYLINKYGSKVLVYKWLPDKYFKLAESVYLKDSRTREPNIFLLEKLIADGEVLNLDSSKQQPRIGVTLWNGFDNESYNEIWDLTELKKFNESMIWDKDTKHFVYDEEAIKKKGVSSKVHGKIKVTIGDKTFEIIM